MDENKESRAQLWDHGVVAAWYLRPSQLDVYRHIRKNKNPFIEAARRWGKTTSILNHVIEYLRANPGHIWRWCLPWKYQAHEIIIPEMTNIQLDCPDHLKFKFLKTGSVYVGPNGSKLYLRGVNEDRGESARGNLAHGITADEYGSWKDPSYIIKEVLRPQLLTTRGKLIKASTPPRDLGHAYYSERDQAEREGRFIQKIIFDNESLSELDLEEACNECGGPDSPAWLREYLCQPVSDPDLLVVPEFEESLWVIPTETAPPSYCDRYVAGDSGVDDNTAILFIYYDFTNDEIVFDDEIVTKGKTTTQILEMARAKEVELWAEKEPTRRVYDASKQLLVDMNIDHKYKVWLPIKHDKHAAIQYFRGLGKQGKIKIKARCKQLIWQLRVGTWKDEKHLDFQRSDLIGHLDAIAAAVYGVRSVDKSINPFPQRQIDIYREFPDLSRPPVDELNEQIARALQPFRGRR